MIEISPKSLPYNSMVQLQKNILPEKIIFSIPIEKKPIGNKKGWSLGYINLYYLDFNTYTKVGT
jgi:hypothetical protein